MQQPSARKSSKQILQENPQLLHLQDQQHRAAGSHQLHVPMVPQLERCLSDIDKSDLELNEELQSYATLICRCFTRGWTLQELSTPCSSWIPTGNSRAATSQRLPVSMSSFFTALSSSWGSVGYVERCLIFDFGHPLATKKDGSTLRLELMYPSQPVAILGTKIFTYAPDTTMAAVVLSFDPFPLEPETSRQTRLLLVVSSDFSCRVKKLEHDKEATLRNLMTVAQGPELAGRRLSLKGMNGANYHGILS
ncbi:hypothetical protein QBC45DRAFT_66799 [Copromyces sp. CBS 386.78]|nr:hypothetical protein QBC45DRAFT_66799 [Copromyces sp. CBS 386.78]